MLTWKGFVSKLKTDKLIGNSIKHLIAWMTDLLSRTSRIFYKAHIQSFTCNIFHIILDSHQHSASCCFILQWQSVYSHRCLLSTKINI